MLSTVVLRPNDPPAPDSAYALLHREYSLFANA
jgi:hypothetical protein